MFGVVIVWSRNAPRLVALRIPPEGFSLGRDSIDPEDDRLSRDHVRVFPLPDHRIGIEDRSTNGTRINNADLDPEAAATWVRPPGILRIGRTVALLVDDIERYEQCEWSRVGDVPVGVTLGDTVRRVREAALAEASITLDGTFWVGRELGHSYADAVGGGRVYLDTAVTRVPMDRVLSRDAYRTVILALTRPLENQDVFALRTWIETDTRWVIVMKREAESFRGLPKSIQDRLQLVRVRIPPLRLDELPQTLYEMVTERSPEALLHASAVEMLLEQSMHVDEDVLLFKLSQDLDRLGLTSKPRKIQSRHLSRHDLRSKPNYAQVGRPDRRVTTLKGVPLPRQVRNPDR